jgi:hypothetical protein
MMPQANETAQVQQPGRHSLWWIIAAASVLLWLWALFAWEIDAPSAMFVVQNLKAAQSSVGDSLYAWFRWIVAVSVVVGALIVWRTRSQAWLGSLVFAFPVALLALWYVTEDLPARRAMMCFLLQQQAAAQAAACAGTELLGEGKSGTTNR